MPAKAGIHDFLSRGAAMRMTSEESSAFLKKSAQKTFTNPGF